MKFKELLYRSYVLEINGIDYEYEFEKEFLDHISDEIGEEDFDIVDMFELSEGNFVVCVQKLNGTEKFDFDYEMSIEEENNEDFK